MTQGMITMKNRRGFSLVELTVAVAFVGVLSALVAPKVSEANDQNNILAAKRVVVTHFSSAQSSAVQRGRSVKVTIENDSIWLTLVRASGDSAITSKRSLAALGADVETTVASVTYDSRGFATGLPLTGAKVLFHGIGVSDSLCVTRTGMVLRKGCL